MLIDLFFAALIAFGISAALTALIPTVNTHEPPRLVLCGQPFVGYGCENTSGPIYANEEDHFPICVNIESNRP
jgi:hypothetical protein